MVWFETTVLTAPEVGVAKLLDVEINAGSDTKGGGDGVGRMALIDLRQENSFQFCPKIFFID